MIVLDPLHRPSSSNGDSPEKEDLNTQLKEDLFVIRVRLNDGSYHHPCYIPYALSNNGEAAAEAAAYYSRIFAGRGTVSNVLLESSLNDAGVSDQNSIVSWIDLKASLNAKFLSDLELKGVQPDILFIVHASLQVEQNRASFLQLVKDSFYSESEQAEILSALKAATRAHRGAVAARPQDTEGLFHVPYINHSISMAANAVRLGLSARGVQVSLLHDGVEETSLSHTDLTGAFSREVADSVVRLTPKSDQSRESFMTEVAALTGELQAIKGLDRLDNLIRSFGIQDKRYIERILAEDKAVYHRIFDDNASLAPLRAQYHSLHDAAAALWDIKGF